MKYYAYKTAENGERFALDDGTENTIVVTADSVEQAEKKFREIIDTDIVTDLDHYMPPTKIDDFEEWSEKNRYYVEM